MKYENDIRAGRFESQIRLSELTRKPGRIFMCSECRKPLAENSKHCPFCDKPRMGEIKIIPEQYVEEANRRAQRRLKAKYGA